MLDVQQRTAVLEVARRGDRPHFHQPDDDEEIPVSAIDKAKNKAQELGGKGKQAVRRATGDNSLKAEEVKNEKAGQVKTSARRSQDVVK